MPFRRQLHHEGGAAARSIPHKDMAPVQLDDFFRDRESQAVVLLVRAGAFDPVKALEDMRLVLVRDSVSGVRNQDLQSVVGYLDA